ncbi:MAG: class I SAM-dependent methyltransferase [Phycisphaerales bacterium]|jgi:tellurite methyltransferase|nr:class I SAM-dependent methyltransferase [Phycisphaerales bacterium]
MPEDHSTPGTGGPPAQPVAKPGEIAPLKAHEHAERRDWPGYFSAVAGKPARETLLKALELFERDGPTDVPRFAIDLGCGSGRDTFELLRRGWCVLAVDASELGLSLLKQEAPAEHAARLETLLSTYEEFRPLEAMLLNASYALPFCQPSRFDEVWARIVNAIPAGGRFAGQFFGERDDWAVLGDRVHHTRPQVERLLAEFTIDRLQEVENREAGATGTVKNWHIFHVVAKKRG